MPKQNVTDEEENDFFLNQNKTSETNSDTSCQSSWIDYGFTL